MKPLAKVRGIVCMYKYINPSSGSPVVVVRMASSQISCFCSPCSLPLSPYIAWKKCAIILQGPQSWAPEHRTAVQDNMQRPRDWILELRELQIPPQTVYNHLCYIQKLHLPHYLLLSSRPVPVTYCVKHSNCISIISIKLQLV